MLTWRHSTLVSLCIISSEICFFNKFDAWLRFRKWRRSAMLGKLFWLRQYFPRQHEFKLISLKKYVPNKFLKYHNLSTRVMWPLFFVTLPIKDSLALLLWLKQLQNPYSELSRQFNKIFQCHFMVNYHLGKTIRLSVCFRNTLNEISSNRFQFISRFM